MFIPGNLWRNPSYRVSFIKRSKFVTFKEISLLSRRSGKYWCRNPRILRILVPPSRSASQAWGPSHL